MAVKKSATPKSSSTPKAATTKKAATPKAATPKAPAKKTATKKAPAKKSTKAAPAKTTAKPKAAKKAPAIKLSDGQKKVLSAVGTAKDAGYAAGKGEGKVLESLLGKKLIKRGKKVEGTARYLITKTGTKQLATPASAGTSASSADLGASTSASPV